MTSRSLHETRGAHGSARHSAVLLTLTQRQTSEHPLSFLYTLIKQARSLTTLYCTYRQYLQQQPGNRRQQTSPSLRNSCTTSTCWCLSSSKTQSESIDAVVSAVAPSSRRLGIRNRTHYAPWGTLCEHITSAATITEVNNVSQRRHRRTEALPQ